MGNRAVIGFKDQPVGIYLHWNGGEESVRAFLECAKTYGVRDPIRDSYGVARLVQIIGNFFGGSLSLGIGTLEGMDCDNGDNGLYIVGDGWEIIERKYNRSERAFNDQEYRDCLAYCLERNKPFYNAE